MKNTDRFAVTEDQLRALIAEGLRYGGDWCDLYFEDTVYNDFLLRDSEVSSAGYHIDYGCGIRVLKGEKTGYAYSESTAFEDLVRAARTAGSIASVPAATGHRPFCSTPVDDGPAPDRYPVQKDWNDSDCGGFIPFLKGIENGIRSRESRTLKVIAMLSWSMSEIMMYNSLGELTCDSRPLGSISVQVVFRQGDRVETASVSRSLRKGAEMICDEVAEDPEIVKREGSESWLVDGQCSFYDFLSYFDKEDLYDNEQQDYNTLAGLIIEQLKHIPQAGERTEWNCFNFEIVDMDGVRIDKVLVTMKEESKE